MPRPEECPSGKARVLEIDGQFLYLPCLYDHFFRDKDDAYDRSSDCPRQSRNRSRQAQECLSQDVCLMHKEVKHDVTDVDESIERIFAFTAARDSSASSSGFSFSP